MDPETAAESTSTGAASLDLGSVSSWIAALISLAVLGAHLYIRRRDRPEPDWLVIPSLVLPHRGLEAHLQGLVPGKGKPPLNAALTNVGDGAAYRVGVTGDQCHVVILVRDKDDARGFSTPEFVPRMESGDEVMLLLWPDTETATIDINWRFSPTRHVRTGSVTIALEDQQPVPKRRWYHFKR